MTADQQEDLWYNKPEHTVLVPAALFLAHFHIRPV